MQGDVAAAAARLSIDPRLRLEYSRRIKKMADDLRSRVNAGLLTWEQAAKEAQETRKSHHGNDQDSQYATWACNGGKNEVIG